MDNNSSGIHPAPTGFSNAEITTDPILHFFHFAHLPPKLRDTSEAFFLLARHVVSTVPRNAERTVALRKLLEAKDAAVRANLPAPGFNQGSSVASDKPLVVDDVQEVGPGSPETPIPFGG